MNRYKLIFNVPLTHADLVRKAVGNAGAGRVGNYSHCSFSVQGTGRFVPNEKASPHIGSADILETVAEEQIQVDVLAADMKAVLAALKGVHPYEEIGYEIYQMIDESKILNAHPCRAPENAVYTRTNVRSGGGG